MTRTSGFDSFTAQAMPPMSPPPPIGTTTASRFSICSSSSSPIVPWPEFFERLARSSFDGPTSLHSEYQGKGSWRDLTTAELIEQTRADLAFVKALLAAHPKG